MSGDTWQRRVNCGDWGSIAAELSSVGGAVLPELLSPAGAEQLRGLYEQAGLFRSRDRPVQSARGWSAAQVRHGVSVIRSGQRHTLGLVFHDAA